MVNQDSEANVSSGTALVSVVIPFRNREAFLTETVQSVLTQSYSNVEIILVDDGSTDSGPQIAELLKSEHPDKISLFEQEGGVSRGASSAREIGLINSRGELVKFLDSDDVLQPNAIELEVQAFASNPDVDAVCGLIECWYSWDKSHDESDFIIPFEVEHDRAYEKPALLVHNLVAGGNKPGIDSVTVKREFALREGLFEDEFDFVGEDQLFWAKLSFNGRIFVLPDVLARYRQHTDSSCSIASRSGDDIESLAKVIQWMEGYLTEQEADSEVMSAFESYKRRHLAERRLAGIKGVYRSIFSLETRYRIRNMWVKVSKLLRPSHR